MGTLYRILKKRSSRGEPWSFCFSNIFPAKEIIVLVLGILSLEFVLFRPHSYTACEIFLDLY